LRERGDRSGQRACYCDCKKFLIHQENLPVVELTG